MVKSRRETELKKKQDKIEQHKQNKHLVFKTNNQTKLIRKKLNIPC